MTTYRVRKQGVTGKLILQTPIGGDWYDVRDSTAAQPGVPFEIVPVAKLQEMLEYATLLRARVDKYDRRAAGQKKAAEARKATAALKTTDTTP